MSVPSLLPARYKVATEPLRTQRNIELFAVILVLVLCLQLLYSGARLALRSLPDAVSPAPDALMVKKLQPLGKVSVEQSAEVLARPLFWQSRRPQDAQAVGQVKKNVAPDNTKGLQKVRLLGVFGGAETAGMIVAVKGGQRRILLGEEIEGWTLESVESNQAVLSADGRQQSLQLKTVSVPVASDPPAPEAQAETKAKSTAQSAGGATEDELSLGGGPRK